MSAIPDKIRNTSWAWSRLAAASNDPVNESDVKYIVRLKGVKRQNLDRNLSRTWNEQMRM